MRKQQFFKIQDTLRLTLVTVFLLFAIPGFSETYDIKESISFAELQGGAEKAVNKEAKKIYKKLKKEFKSKCRKSAKAYKFLNAKVSCDLNLNRLLKGRREKLLDVKVPKQKLGTFRGAKVYLSKSIRLKSVIEPIYQNYKAPLLDLKRKVLVREEKRIEKNIFLKHKPAGRSLYSSGCVELPGYRVKTKASKIYGKVHKKYWIFSIKANIKAVIDLGQYQYKSARVCGAAKASFKEDLKNYRSVASLKKSFQIKQIYLQKPKISKIKYRPLKLKKLTVSGGNLLTRIIIFFLKPLKIKIENQVKAQINKEIKRRMRGLVDATNRDIQSARVWKKIMDKMALGPEYKMVANINKAVNSSIKKETVKSIAVDRKTFTNLCNEVYNGVEADSSLKFLDRDCSLLIEKIEITPFLADRKSKRKKCYNYYYMVNSRYVLPHKNQKKNRWYLNNCKISSRVRVTPAKEFEESFACLYKGYKENMTEDQLVDTCYEVLVSEGLELDLDLVDDLLEVENINELKGLMSNDDFVRVKSKIRFKAKR